MQMIKKQSFTVKALFSAVLATLMGVVLFIPAPSQAVTIEDLRPDNPYNVRVVKRGPKTATVKWSAEDMATEYEVRLYRSGGKDIAIVENIKGTSYTIKSKWLKPNRKYYVRVRAVNEDLGSFITEAEKVYFRTKPGKPKHISVTSKKRKKVTMRWHKPANKVRFYRVQVKEYDSNGNLTRKWREKVKNGADVVEHTVDDLKKKRKYKIRIQSGFNSKNIGKYSDWTVIQPR